MKPHTEYGWFELPGRQGFANIVDAVAEQTQMCGVFDGLRLFNAIHGIASPRRMGLG
jgi:hypothetical protein